jgi:hypothetical protein
MAQRKWKPHYHSDEAASLPPKYWPGDPVILDDGTSATVEYARRDGMVCVMLPSGKHEWLHEDCVQWAPSFQPTRRR